MSRSDYSDDLDQQDLAMYRGWVASAIRGKRGQRLLRELAEAMDAMPVKELIADELEADGQYCALGVVGAKRQIDMKNIDPYDYDAVAEKFDIAACLAREIAFINDDDFCRRETPADRWKAVRKWVSEQLEPSAGPPQVRKQG